MLLHYCGFRNGSLSLKISKREHHRYFPKNLYCNSNKPYSKSSIEWLEFIAAERNSKILHACNGGEKMIVVMYLTQNLFPPGKLSCTISLNSHYMITFKNPRDSLGISTLTRQMYPHNTNFLLQSFQDATKKPYGYLLLDLHQLTH